MVADTASTAIPDAILASACYRDHQDCPMGCRSDHSDKAHL